MTVSGAGPAEKKNQSSDLAYMEDDTILKRFIEVICNKRIFFSQCGECIENGFNQLGQRQEFYCGQNG